MQKLLERGARVFWSLVLLLVAMPIRSSEGIKWLGLQRHSPQVDSRQLEKNFCGRLQHTGLLSRKQYKFCQRFGVDKVDPGAISAVIKSARRTVEVCRLQFRHFRWNCNVLQHIPQLAPELKSLTAEQALVHALSGLVLATTFAEECSRGTVRRCVCGTDPTWLAQDRPAWRFRFEGCHTNIKAGQRLARKFLTGGAGGRGHGRGGEKKPGRRGAGGLSTKRRLRPRVGGGSGGGEAEDDDSDEGGSGGGGSGEVYRKFVRMVNSYNYNIGIEAVRHSEAVRCKCHGSSASCTMRTCHRVLHQRSFQQLETTYFRRSDRDPLDLLLEMYDKKLRKTVFDESGYQGYEEPCTHEDRVVNPLRPEPKCEVFKTIKGMPQTEVLLFHEHSLDYCNQRDGKFPGTHGRECLPDGSVEAQKILQNDAAGEKKREIVCSVMCCGRPYRNVTETHEGTHEDCQSKSCRLLSNPFRIVCKPCQLRKSYCN